MKVFISVLLILVLVLSLFFSIDESAKAKDIISKLNVSKQLFLYLMILSIKSIFKVKVNTAKIALILNKEN